MGSEASRRVLPEAEVARLVEVCGELKGELVEFARSKRFSHELDAYLEENSGRRGFADEAVFVMLLDAFMLQHRLPGGSTVVERLVAQRRPAFTAEQKEILLGWRDVVDGVFEVGPRRGSALMLHNLCDDLEYRVWSNMGAAALAPMKKGMFVITRLVPVYPDGDTWVLSGHPAVFRRSAGPDLAQAALGVLTANPGSMRRNPDRLRMAWERQGAERDVFVEVAGDDMAVGAPQEIQALLLAFRDLQEQRLRAAMGDGPDGGLGVEETARLPQEMFECDTVAVFYDEVEGIHYFGDFGAVLAAFTAPPAALVRDRSRLEPLKDYLADPTVPPFVFRRLAATYPDVVDRVFEVLLGKKGFCWERDGDRLLRRRKPEFYDREPMPSYSVVGDRLAELLRKGR